MRDNNINININSQSEDKQPSAEKPKGLNKLYLILGIIATLLTILISTTDLFDRFTGESDRNTQVDRRY